MIIFAYHTNEKGLPKFAFNFSGSARHFYTISPGDEKIGELEFKYECLDESYRRVDTLAELKVLEKSLDEVVKKAQISKLNNKDFERIRWITGWFQICMDTFKPKSKQKDF